MTPETELWRKYLRRDPSRFLLDAEANPSVYLWYLIDIAHRPETSAAVLEMRERVLFSQPVQEIFSRQREDGSWPPTHSLGQPHYTATLWNIALLAELGIPHDSRRARAACEFVLENFLEEGGHFRTLNLIESCFLIHALAYFRGVSDERVVECASALAGPAEQALSLESLVILLWAWTKFREDPMISLRIQETRDRLLNTLAAGDVGGSAITFPQFDPRDPMFVLRVLALHDGVNDVRSERLVLEILARQNAQSHWPLDISLNGNLATRTEEPGPDSRWATLNALRIIVKLVTNGGSK